MCRTAIGLLNSIFLSLYLLNNWC